MVNDMAFSSIFMGTVQESMYFSDLDIANYTENWGKTTTAIEGIAKYGLKLIAL